MALFFQQLHQDCPMLRVNETGRHKQFRDQRTRGVGQERYQDGWLWMSLGYFLYQHGTPGPEPDTTSSSGLTQHEGVLVWVRGAGYVREGYRELTKTIKETLGPADPLADTVLRCDNLLEGTRLTDPEVAEVQRVLLEALHVKCVMFRSRAVQGRTPADLARGRLRPQMGGHACRLAPAGQPGLRRLHGHLPRGHRARQGHRAPAGAIPHPHPRDICLALGHQNGQQFPWCCESIYHAE
ncbi:hypothetical protein PG996_000012 [Apiospora saccharicola]|uniref:Uncharacterized protein n=1 Tax=Apiospora saccharicola TaxID=335842 RepID=A0ABR1WFE3_9PEZI